MSTLHDQLYGFVTDHRADHRADRRADTLTRTAPRRGLGWRRRRRALTTVGTAAAALAIGAPTYTLVPGGPSRATPDTLTAPTAAADPHGERTVGITGRSTAAILLEAIGEQRAVAIETASIRGGGGVDVVDADGAVIVPAAQNSETYAELRAVDEGFSMLVAVDVQPLGPVASAPGTECTASYALACRVTPLLDGSLLRSYRDEESTRGKTRHVAELISERRDLRVVVEATVERGEAPLLNGSQLAAIATYPAWGHQVSADYAAQGEALTSWESIDPVAGAAD